MRSTNIVSAILRVIVAAIAIVTVVNLLHASGPKGLLTFTVQSNSMMAISFLWTAHTLVWRKHTPPEWLSGSSVFYLAITGIVYNVVLGPEIPGSSPAVILGLSNSTLEHVVTPIAAMAIWIVFDEHRRIPWKYVWIWLIYLVAYLVLVFSAIALIDSYSAPYPFLDIGIHGVGGVALRIAGYMSAFAVLSAAMIWLDHALPERTPLSEYDPHDQG